MGPDEITARLRERFAVDARSEALLFQFVELVETAKLNITAWTGDVLWTRGVMESLDLRTLLPNKVHGRGLDIGSGGGFPGMILAIAYPEWSWTLMDSRMRRCQFLTEAAAHLNLSNVLVVNARAEDWIKQNMVYRDHFDVVTMRAVAPKLPSLELGLPYARIGGVMLLAQGVDGKADDADSVALIKRLGGQTVQTVKHTEGRQTICLHKVANTPSRYPRSGKALGRI